MIHPSAKIHPLAFIDDSVEIGENCVVWQFASILKGVKLGKGVSVGAGSEIGIGSIIGAGSRISAQVFLPSNSILEDRVFLGPGVKATDDRAPFAGNPSYVAEPPYFESGSSVGAGSIILPGRRLGAGCLVGAGSIVTRDVPAHAHVRGEPAREKSYSKMPGETSYDIYAPAIRDRVIAGEAVRER